MLIQKKSLWLRALALYGLLAGCALVGEIRGTGGGGNNANDVSQHRWWSGFGPVLSHETFPEDCSLCHVGSNWHELREDFEFDHGAVTGHALEGSHAEAACLRCHNDRGPVQVFESKGCVGCHGDTHQGTLSTNCKDCHNETSWSVLNASATSGITGLHRRAGFALIGAHAMASCSRCHPGIDRGEVTAESKSCAACHGSDLKNALNPNHVALGWTSRCDDCHQPLTWQGAEL